MFVDNSQLLSKQDCLLLLHTKRIRNFITFPTGINLRRKIILGPIMDTLDLIFLHQSVHLPSTLCIGTASFLSRGSAVIFSQIVIESHGTRLVKNHESQSRTNESQLKKRVWNWKCWDLYVKRQLISKDTLQNSVLQYDWKENIVLLL